MKKHELLNILIILLYMYKGFLSWIKKYKDKCNEKNEITKIKKNFNFFSQVPDEIKEIGEIYKLVDNLETNVNFQYFEYQKILVKFMKKQKNDGNDDYFRFC